MALHIPITGTVTISLSTGTSHEVGTFEVTGDSRKSDEGLAVTVLEPDLRTQLAQALREAADAIEDTSI